MTGIFPARPTSKAVTKYTYGPILHKIWAQPVFKENFSEALYFLCKEVNVTLFEQIFQYSYLLFTNFTQPEKYA